MNHWGGILLIYLVKFNNNTKEVFMKNSIKTCIDAIDQYHNILTNGTFTNIVGILGSLVGGKIWCGMYVILYIISKYLK